MPITAVTSDPERLTLTVVADFPVPRPRLWVAYTDPRQIEKFWGPPTYPATFTRHDAHPGGRSSYVMVGPEGDRSGGYWEWTAVDAPRSFEVLDGFAREDGTPDTSLPATRMVFDFEETGGGSRVTVTSHFDSLEDLERLLGMGMDEGMRLAMGQIDAVVEDLASFAAGRAAEEQVLSDTQVRISRVIRGSVDEVWRAHSEPELLRRWQLGPDGWAMPVCEVATEVGHGYRYEWEPVAGGRAADQGRFGFEGEVTEIDPPHRVVTTERMIGTDGPETLNELTLVPTEGGTLLTVVVTYPDAETRDMILATGMTGGMEESYARLERELLRAEA